MTVSRRRADEARVDWRALHAAQRTRLHQKALAGLRKLAQLSVNHPVRCSDVTLVAADLVVLHERSSYYREAFPTPNDVHFIIEVAGPTLWRDRQGKGETYAKFAIPEYWIVNLVDRVIEVYRDPADGEYRSVEIARPGDHLAPLAFPDVRIAVSDILV